MIIKFFKEKIYKNNLTLYAFLLSFIVIFYSLIYYDKYLPIQEGWFNYYSQLYRAGQFPYRDFYLPIPPVFFIICDFILNRFGNYFIYLRIYGIFERVLLVILIFNLLRKYFTEYYVFIAVIMGFFFYTSFNVDLPYSYYQTTFLLSFLASLFLYYSFENNNSISNFYLLLSGILFGVVIFTKQSSGFLYIIFVPFIIIFIFTFKKDFFYSFKKFLIWFLGFFLLSFILIYWLYINNSLLKFYEVVFKSVSSKGDKLNILFGFILRFLWYKPLQILISLALTIFVTIILYKNITIKKYIFETKYYLAFTISLILMIIFSLFFRTKIPIAKLDQILVFMVFFTNIFILLKYLYFFIREKNNYFYLFLFFWSFFSVIWMYGHGMSGFLEIHSVFLGLPLIISLFMSHLDCISHKRFFYFINLSFIFLIYFISVERYITPYEWWGWKEPSIKYSKYILNINEFRGFKLSFRNKKIYEKIYEIINLNKNKDSELFAFPHMLIFNVITGVKNSNYVPVTYFDVCADKYAVETSYYLLKKKPHFILFMSFSENDISIHEKIFRGGKYSGQREIIKAIEYLERHGNYEVAFSTIAQGAYPLKLLIRKKDILIKKTL